MKTLKLKSIILGLVAVLATAITMISCEQNALENLPLEALETQQSTEIDLKAPNIRASVESGDCCRGGSGSFGPPYTINTGRRDVEIRLNSLTYSYFCSGGNTLVYKFFRYGAPNSAPIIKTSGEYSPTFCLPAVDMALIICDTGDCDVTYSNGNFVSVPNTGDSSSPIYSIRPDNCIVNHH